MGTTTPNNIMQIGMGFWASKALLSAVELGVFTELATGPAELPDLQARLKLHSRSARDFLDTLVALKLLEREDGSYRNALTRISSSIASSKWPMPGSTVSGVR